MRKRVLGESFLSHRRRNYTIDLELLLIHMIIAFFHFHVLSLDSFSSLRVGLKPNVAMTTLTSSSDLVNGCAKFNFCFLLLTYLLLTCIPCSDQFDGLSCQLLSSRHRRSIYFRLTLLGSALLLRSMGTAQIRNSKDQHCLRPYFFYRE